MKDEVERLLKLFRMSSSACEQSRKDAEESEEYFFSDVDNTLHHLTERQLKAIEETYNIPIGMKFSFAMVEQLLSFLTSNKPTIRFLSSEKQTEHYPIIYEKLFKATWYESKGNLQVTNAIRDSLITGTGYLIVRKAQSPKESTTRVVIEHKNWKHIYIDPECRKSDLSDAQFVIIVDILRKKIAEERYDIKIPDDASANFSSLQYPELVNFYSAYEMLGDDDYKYVFTLEFFEKKETNIYMGMNPFADIAGIFSVKRPIPIDIPNPQIALHEQKIAELEAKELQLSQMFNASEENSSPSEDMLDAQLDNRKEHKRKAVHQQLTDIGMQKDLLIQEMNKLPKKIPAFRFIKEGPNKEEVIVTEVIKLRDYRIWRNLVVGDTLVEREILPNIDEIPVVQFPFAWLNAVKKYGIIHFFKDINDAYNKYISEIMYDISVNGHRKGFVFDTTIIENSNFEADYAKPNSLIKLRPDYQLQDGGKPYILEPSNINQSIHSMLNFFREMIEYITGIYGVIQGDPNTAPQTFGATQSLQNFGTQRIKLYSRNLENAFARLAYITVKFLIAYCERDIVIKYFDEESIDEIVLLEDVEDINFKVRVDVVSSLPTSRQQTAQTLGFIAQTAGSPELTALLLKYYLEISDVPEGKKMAEEIDVVKQLQQQVQQLNEQLKQLAKQNETVNKELMSKTKESIKKQVESETIINNLQNPVEEEETELV